MIATRSAVALATSQMREVGPVSEVKMMLDDPWRSSRPVVGTMWLTSTAVTSSGPLGRSEMVNGSSITISSKRR